MKRKYQYIGALTLLLATAGCNEKNFLSQRDPNKVTDALFWKDESSVLSALAATYSPLRSSLYGYWGSFHGIQDINTLGDDVFTIPGGEPAAWGIASLPTTRTTATSAAFSTGSTRASTAPTSCCRK